MEAPSHRIGTKFRQKSIKSCIEKHMKNRRRKSKENERQRSKNRAEITPKIYEKPIYPPNRFPSGHPPKNQAEKVETTKTVLNTLYQRGQFVPPHGMNPDEMPGVLDQRIQRAQSQGTLLKDDE